MVRTYGFSAKYVFDIDGENGDCLIYETEEQAIEAAQQDYARRVLSGLKYTDHPYPTFGADKQ